MNPLIESLLSLLYPRVCPVCGEVMVESERIMCLACRLKLLVTGFEKRPEWNPMMEKLMCHAPIARCAAYFYYQREAPHSKLIHRIKYSGQPSLGRELMREYAKILKTTDFFDGIDAIAPVPLSFSRLCARGYNQSYRLALGVSDITSLPIIDALRATRHRSQTRLGAEARSRNASGIYSARRKSLAGVRHMLLIDDIVTTGATVRACAESLHEANPTMKLSVLSLANTRLG